MDTQMVFVYCLCDDLLKALQHGEDRQCRVSDAEILTVALVAALYFGGHFQRANEFLHEQGYLPRRLGASRFNRRIHRCVPFGLPLFHGLAALGHQLRACSSSFDEDSEESENDHVSACVELSFAVFPEAAGFFEPAEGALDDPAFGQDCERMEFVAFDDLHRRPDEVLHAGRKRFSRVTPVNQHVLHV